jgi:hypothetical protein
VANATALMRGPYRELFPTGFAEAWERETHYSFGRMEFHRLRAEQLECLDRLEQVRPGLSNPQRLALVFLAAVMWVQSVVFAACLVAGNYPRFTVRRVLARGFGFLSPKVS